MSLARPPLPRCPPFLPTTHPSEELPRSPFNPGIPQEGQHCRSRSLVVEHSPHGRGHRSSHFAQPPDLLPHDSCLAGPSRATGNEVESWTGARSCLTTSTCSSRSYVSCPEDMSRSLRGQRGVGSTSRPVLSWCCKGADGGGLSSEGSCTGGRSVRCWRSTLPRRATWPRWRIWICARGWPPFGARPGPGLRLHGAGCLAVALAKPPASSLPAPLLWAGAQRMVTSLS